MLVETHTHTYTRTHSPKLLRAVSFGGIKIEEEVVLNGIKDVIKNLLEIGFQQLILTN